MFTVTHCSESKKRDTSHSLALRPAPFASTQRDTGWQPRFSTPPINHDDFRYTSIRLAIMIVKCVTRALLEIYTAEIVIRNGSEANR